MEARPFQSLMPPEAMVETESTVTISEGSTKSPGAVSQPTRLIQNLVRR